ncbi:MAG: hypothetical protein J7K22_03005 [Nanoarchaeota archaeon]|nr:hypothetical protein [Nanoarchaeota archaeon]
MKFQEISNKINKGTSKKIHKYYQKLLAYLFLMGKDPFGRKLLSIEAEKKTKKGVCDLFIEWDYKGKKFSEIIEVELRARKKDLENKIKIYNEESDLFSLCVSSKKIKPLMSTFFKMKKNLWKINFIYIIDTNEVTKNKRKITENKNMVLIAHSPFFIMQCKGDYSCIKELVNSKRSLLFESFILQYLKK